MSVIGSKEITRTTRRTSRISTIFAVVIAVALVSAAGLISPVLAVKSSTKTNSSTSLKKFFDCVSDYTKNGNPSRLDVDYCYDTTNSSSGVSTSASAGKNGASAVASAGIP